MRVSPPVPRETCLVVATLNRTIWRLFNIAKTLCVQLDLQYKRLEVDLYQALD